MTKILPNIKLINANTLNNNNKKYGLILFFCLENFKGDSEVADILHKKEYLNSSEPKS